MAELSFERKLDIFLCVVFCCFFQISHAVHFGIQVHCVSEQCIQ